MRRFLKHLFDPFELLYISIAIATFTHTQFTAALYFEGDPPTNDPVALGGWYLHGALIAIAIDVGMLLTSRFIASATDPYEVITLVVAFSVAAVASFFTQLGYILMHTPTTTISGGVSPYWQSALSGLIDARVVILPFLLPAMGIIYTVARVARTKRIMRQERLRVLRSPVIHITTLSDMVTMLTEGVKPRLPSEVLPSGEYINWEERKFYDPDNGVWKGPYPSVEIMLKTMNNLSVNRKPKSLAITTPSETTGRIRVEKEVSSTPFSSSSTEKPN